MLILLANPIRVWLSMIMLFVTWEHMML